MINLVAFRLTLPQSNLPNVPSVLTDAYVSRQSLPSTTLPLGPVATQGHPEYEVFGFLLDEGMLSVPGGLEGLWTGGLNVDGCQG